MGISAKGKRKITVRERQYVWNVALDKDTPYLCLNIVSEDKRLILSCPLHMQSNYVISKGNEFQKKKTSGCWERYLCPVEIPEVITPKVVADIIQWAECENNAVMVNWDGHEMII